MNMYPFLPKSVLVIALLMFIFPRKELQRKIINSQEGDYIIYVSLRNDIKPKKSKIYFWYKSGEIHQAAGGIGGEVLHKEYTKYFKNQQLSEKGNFHYGLKDGLWESWHLNGKLSKVLNYRKGVLQGSFLAYDKNGKLLQKGKYRNGLKSSTWIDYSKSGDTLNYKKGIFVNEREDSDTLFSEKNTFFKKLSSWTKGKITLKRDSLKSTKKKRIREEKKEIKQLQKN